MIPADVEQKILRLHFVEKWKIGTIARQLGIHHTTVKRVLHTQGITVPQPTRTSIVEPYLPFMRETLEKYPKLPASRLYAMVRERGYPGGPDHFRRVVAQMRPRKPAEAFQRLRTLPGEQAQVDWAHFDSVQIGRATRRLSAFIMVLSWSRMPFVCFFYNQQMASFLEGHVRAFEFFGGVPRCCLYDNLKSVVTERHHAAIRFNETLLQFASHYRYEPRPVAPYRGNEKARAERRIRHLRTSFWPARTYDDLDDLNVQVADWCLNTVGEQPCPEDTTLTIAQAWSQEKTQLVPLPEDRFCAEERKPVRVGKQPYIRFDLNDYTVPHDRVRRTLVVLATHSTVRIVDFVTNGLTQWQ